MCDMIFSGVFERHPRLTLAIVEFELSWAPNVLTSMDYTYRERHGEAIYRFKEGMLPSEHRLTLQGGPIGIRLRDIIGVDNMMWGSGITRTASRPSRNRARSSLRSWRACPTANRPRSWASTPPASTALTWRG